PVYAFAPLAPGGREQRLTWAAFLDRHRAGQVKAAWAVENGLAEAVMKMSFGNGVGFRADPGAPDLWHTPMYGVIVAEMTCEIDQPGVVRLGVTTDDGTIDLGADKAPIDELLSLNEGVLEDVYPTRAGSSEPLQPISCLERAPLV